MTDSIAAASADVGATWTVNDTLLRYPSTVAVFNQFGVDACCGGANTIAEAARESKVNLDALLAALHDAARGVRA